VSPYQSFPGAQGDSPSLQKLKALRLPSLADQSFLDVGCNEGFFCGYARFDGARRVVGIDGSASVIAQARARFPDCEFLCQTWDRLPSGPFDVILLASALHYAKDQALLIQTLMAELAPGGTLVLELGVHDGTGDEWVAVKRATDARLFPTWRKLQEVLAPYAWKNIGPSAMQQGDSVPRHVVHVRHRKPVAYLLMEPSGFGKSTISRTLFERAAIRIISGDAVIGRVAEGGIVVPPDLAAIVKAQYSPVRIDQVVTSVAKAGLLGTLVDVWLKEAEAQDFALDAFVPGDFHQDVLDLVSAAGYMPIKLSWTRVGKNPPSSEAVRRRSDAYFATLHASKDVVDTAASSAAPPFKRAAGTVERIIIEDETLVVSGWALDDRGELPNWLRLIVGTRTIDLSDFERQLRPDVQKHFGLSHALCGFVVRVKVEPGDRSPDPGEVHVLGGSTLQDLKGPFRTAGHLMRSH
jgi:SAM-dependent methyltransferase